MSFVDRMKRRNHLHETVDRAKTYQRYDRPHRRSISCVWDSCSTMLFDPTDEELAEMVEIVDRR